MTSGGATSTLNLILYDASPTDKAATFSSYRDVQSGAISSNMTKIDAGVAADRARLTALELVKGAITVNAIEVSTGNYSATVASITSLTTGMTIVLTLDVQTSGTTLLNISSLGAKALVKIDSLGVKSNIISGELMIGKNYLFRYDGTDWVWVSATSADQIYISGTVGNHVKIGTNNVLEDGGAGYDLGADIYFTGDITPAQITSNQNDYTPTGLATASTLRLSTDASRDITGLSGGADGRIIIIANVGSFPIVLINGSISSSAANRFLLFSDTTINSNQDVIIQYDSTSSRWRLIGGTGAGGGASNRSWFGV